jgi:hypothetical protein
MQRRLKYSRKRLRMIELHRRSKRSGRKREET